MVIDYRQLFGELDSVPNGENQTNLKEFSIEGLFGRYNVQLSLDKTANIFVGENGLGKTTILRCLYYVLKQDSNALLEIPFKEIQISLKDGELLRIPGNISRAHTRRERYRTSSIDNIILHEIERQNLPYAEDIFIPSIVYHEIAERVAEYTGAPERLVYDRVRRLMMSSEPRENHKKPQIKPALQSIREKIPEDILYLPTYRRIERSPDDFRYDEGPNRHSLMHFGMKDVQDSIDAVLNEIRTQTMQGYNKMAGTLLKEYSQETRKPGYNPSKPIQPETVNIVLNRLGEEIDANCKSKIREITERGEINDDKYQYLRNLLQRLIDNYEKLERYDDQIQQFVETCNRYLNDKSFDYDPSNLELVMRAKDSQKQKIPLPQLSSGEQQIVSLFSKLYLNKAPKSSKNHGTILMIDEPELSLSIEWQKRLLPDIVRSGGCKMLLAMTHSPFIFDNEFEMDAKEIFRRSYGAKEE